MLELNSEIRSWRGRLEHGSSLSSRELDELEDHLRARVDLELELDAALAPAEAFAIAREALGAPSTICKEFAKSGRPRWRRLLLAGWALYAASFLLPAFGHSGVFPTGPDAVTTDGYEIFGDLIQNPPIGLTLLIAVWLLTLVPNLVMLMTALTLWRRHPSRRRWTAWIVGATGALPLALGLPRLGDLGPGFYSGLGYWVWSTSFVIVAIALWLRNREWASARPKYSDSVAAKLSGSSGAHRV